MKQEQARTHHMPGFDVSHNHIVEAAVTQRAAEARVLEEERAAAEKKAKSLSAKINVAGQKISIAFFAGCTAFGNGCTRFGNAISEGAKYIGNGILAGLSKMAAPFRSAYAALKSKISSMSSGAEDGMVKVGSKEQAPLPSSASASVSGEEVTYGVGGKASSKDQLPEENPSTVLGPV